jgi:two-component system, chemotaxis family, sensor kinase Cph1
MLTTVALAGPVDLSTCAREPIHIPGSIQPYGLLFVLEDSSLLVLQASANTEDLFPGGALGKSLEELFGPTWSFSFRNTIRSVSLERNPLYLGTLTLANHQSFHAIAHRLDRTLILELESTASAQSLSFPDLYPLVRNFMADLQSVRTTEDLSALAAREVRRITGFDRVLIYQFDPHWNGHVIAEDRDEALSPYLDLWFPASDIPQQARELYRLNRLRLIADAEYRPVPVQPALHPVTKQPLDLSFANLRSVSPVHIEYLKNMGVRASMSISVLRNGQLWGLISCHHRSARMVPFEIRTACDFLGQAFALQLSAAEQSADYEHRLRLKLVQSQLLAFMAQEENFVDGLTKHPEEFLDFAGATGAAVLFEDRCTLVGSTPTEEAVRALADWLPDQQHQELFCSDCFSTLVPHPEDYRETASGVLAISISRLYRSYVFWFRPEVMQTVAWGGDPRKAVEQETDGSLRLHPRKSFEAWKETVRGRSIPWGAAEIETVRDLRSSILGIVLRRAEEVAQLSGELQRSNKELEAFSYSVSHDLRAPFRHIVGYSSLLRERLEGHEDQEALRYLDTIAESARSAGMLVDNLLHFSQIGRCTLNLSYISQAALVAEVKKEIEREIPAERQIEWRIGELPERRGDLPLLRLVWQNLLANAVKYTRPRDHTVIEIGSEEEGQETIFFVRDNGVGFDQRYVDKLFGVFQRLHRVEDFEGNGIGLANVRRIVARHGGRTWAEGAVGKGATFYFSLPKQSAMDEQGG